MDRRTREVERRWSESRNTHDHVALLNCLMRGGLLEKRRVLCAGFFGHKASILALPEEIKRHKVVINAHFGAKTLHTEELNDFIFNIFYWPRDVYLRAVLGASKLCAQQIVAPSIVNDINVINMRLQDYIDDEKKYEEYRIATTRRHGWYGYGISSWGSRNTIITRNLSELLRRINQHANTAPRLQALGANFKDKIFRKAIGGEVIPYLLGEWT